jgi:1,4-alpha-glucan branching enzyme
LLFMGNEFGQTSEWNYRSELDWHLLDHAPHEGMRKCVRDLNFLLKASPALYTNQFHPDGFRWADLSRREESVIAYRRISKNPEEELLVILNLTPVPRLNWEIIVGDHSYTTELFNSDSTEYWGDGRIFNPDIRSEVVNKDEKRFKLTVNLPPLSALIFK